MIMRVFLLLLLLISGFIVLDAQQSHIQFIHNSPILGTNVGPVVDIYVDGVLRPPLTGFEFREATSFLSFDADTNVVVDVRMNPSTPMDSIILSFEILELEEDESYTLVLGGVDISIPQLPPLQFFINNDAKQMAASENTVAVNGFHGGIILPRVDIGERSRGSLFDMEYGEFANYQTLENESYFLFADVENFGFPFNYVADFNGLGGKAVTLFVSGAALNSPEWGIFAATSDGEVFELPLTLLGTVQLFNNVEGDDIDIYLDSVLWIEDLHYQSAIPYTVVESERVLEFGIAPAGSESYDDVFTTVTGGFETDRFYTLVLNGSRDTMPFPISLEINPEVRQMALEEDQFDYNIFQGLQDTTLLSFSIKGTGSVVDSLSFGSYSDYFSLDTSRYFLDVRIDTSSELLYSFILELPPLLAGNAVTLVLSGHPDEPDEVKMFALFADGSIFELERLLYGQVQFINNIPGTNLQLYQGPELIFDSLEYRSATNNLLVPAGEEVSLSLVRVQDGSLTEAFVVFQIEVVDTLLYTMVLNGIIDEDDFPLEIIAHEIDSLPLVDANDVNYLFFHGVYGIDSLDVLVFDGPELLIDFPYKTFSGDFTSANELTYFNVRSSTDEDVVFTYEGDFSNLGGSALKLLFSGSRGDMLDMVLLGVEEDGSVFEFRETTLARVQYVHRLAGVPIDVYLDDELLLEDFTPDSATEFLNIEGGLTYQIGIAPSGSTSASDTVAAFMFTPVGGEEYTIVAAGLPETEDQLFDLFVNEDSQSTAESTDSIDLNFFHSTFFFDTIHIELIYEGELENDLSFGDFSSYKSLSNEYYLLKVVSSLEDFDDFIVELDLRTYAGQSLTLIFAEDEDDFDNPRLLAVSADGEVIELPRRELGRVQFIQNIASFSGDLFINGYLLDASFEYGEASPFIDIVGDVDAVVVMTTSGEDTEILRDTLSFNTDQSQIVFLDGSIEDDDQTPRLSVFDAAKEVYQGQADSLDLAFHHGAPALDSLSLILSDDTVLIEALAQYEFEGYQNLDNFLSLMDVVSHPAADWIATFLLDLRTLNDQVMMAWINESSANSERYSLFLAYPNGDVTEISAAGEAQVQLLHNAPALAVDIYVNGQVLLEELEFRTATPFVTLPAEVPLEISITLHDETEVIFMTTIQLTDEENYLIVANGLVGNMDTPFGLEILENARRMAIEDDQTDIAFFHGAPDSPALTFDSRNFGLLIDELMYGQFSSYLALDTTRYLIDLKDQLSGELIESYEADFSGVQGRAGLIFASGVEGEAAAEFGLYILFDSGLVVPLSTISLANVQFIHNAQADAIDIYYGSERIMEGIAFREATEFIELPAFPGLDIGIALAGSQDVSEAFYTVEPNFQNLENYVVFAYGLPGSFNPDFLFGLNIIDNVRLESVEDNTVDVFLYHGAPELVGIDLNSEIGDLIFRDIRYNEFSDYASLTSTDQLLDFVASGTGVLLGTYLASFDAFNNQSLVIFASDMTGAEPPFEPWVALTDGTTFPLEFVVSTYDPALGVHLKVFPNPVVNTTLVDVKLDQSLSHLRMELADMSGRLVYSRKMDFLPAGHHTIELNVDQLAPGAYILRLVGSDSHQGVQTILVKN